MQEQETVSRPSAGWRRHTRWHRRSGLATLQLHVVLLQLCVGVQGCSCVLHWTRMLMYWMVLPVVWYTYVCTYVRMYIHIHRYGAESRQSAEVAQVMANTVMKQTDKDKAIQGVCVFVRESVCKCGSLMHTLSVEYSPLPWYPCTSRVEAMQTLVTTVMLDHMLINYNPSRQGGVPDA